jgi:hypothetical protein
MNETVWMNARVADVVVMCCICKLKYLFLFTVVVLSCSYSDLQCSPVVCFGDSWTSLV